MRYAVRVTASAERDIESIYRYLEEKAVRTSAEAFLDQLEAAVASLSRWPARGAHPHELTGLKMNEYRQLQLPPYRIIYRIAGRSVFIEIVADGRRDMRTLLQQRLLAPY